MAATGVNWGGSSGGTESAPLDVYDLSKWSGVSELSDAYNLVFDVGNVPTILTNSAATGTKIANNFTLNYGTWTLLGDYKFSSIDANNKGTDPKVTTIVKKGDWELTWAAYFGRAGATTILTNVSGKIEQTAPKWFQIGNGDGGLAVVENLSGDWTLEGQLAVGHGKGSAGEIYWRGGDLESKHSNGPNFAYGANTTAHVEKNAGDWTMKKLTLGDDAESEATFIHRGGSMTVSGDLVASVGSNSVVTIEKDDGDWTLATFKLGQGANNVYSEAKTTFRHNGGATSVSGRFDMSNFGSCDFYMNGGSVTAGEVWFGTWMLKNKWHHATIHLAGGVFAAKCFYLHNSDNAKLSKVVFDGGTFRATTSGNMIYGNSSRYNLDDSSKLSDLRNRFGVEVGPRGGTIDTAGYNITNVVNFTRTSGSAGGMRFIGGGKVVLTGTVGYQGKTFVDGGTMLEVVNSTAKSNILEYGLELSGIPELNTPYTIFTCAEELTEEDLANVTCGIASEFSKAIGTDGRSIVVTRTGALRLAYWTGAKDGNLSDGENWSDGIVPTGGNPTISCASAATLVVGDMFKPDTLTVPDGSAVITIMGDLTLATLTNAAKLAIAQGASLTVEGELVQTDTAAAPICLLYSNEGTVSVGGKVRYYGRDNAVSLYQYNTATANSQPIRAKGLAYDCHGNSKLYSFLYSYSGDMTGKWVLGSDGISFPTARQASYSRFYTQSSAPVTLGSSADWTLANSGKESSSGGDLFAQSGGSITLDTSNCDDPTVGHVITLNGRILIDDGAANPGLVVKGCGTVVVNTTGSHASLTEKQKNTCINTALYVMDGATLQVNPGKKIMGAGEILLQKGTTLALPVNDDRTFTTPDIVPVILPADGKATIRIDGRRLDGGVDHVLLNSVPEGYAEHLTVVGTAVADRRVRLRAEGGKLLFNIEPQGLAVILK